MGISLAKTIPLGLAVILLITACNGPYPLETGTPSPSPSPSPTATIKVATPSPSPTPSPVKPTPTPAVARQFFFPLIMTAGNPDEASTADLIPDEVKREAEVPILMYHHISEVPADADAVRRDLTVTPANFEAQLRYLAKEGYESITLKDLLFHLQMGRPLPPKPIILTFEDGYRDNFTEAHRLLQKYGFRGTFFLITSPIDEGREEYLTWRQVKRLHAAGMELGSHTYTHPDLRDQPYDYLVWQILGSKEAIEARIKVPVCFFSYPSGRYDEQVIEVLKRAGFWGAVTIKQGALQSSEHPFELERIRVRGSYSLRDFAYWLNFWLENSE